MKKYRCTVCDWVYDPAVGDPEHGVPAGTAFEDIPEDWVCPECGVGKDDFVAITEHHTTMNDVMVGDAPNDRHRR